MHIYSPKSWERKLTRSHTIGKSVTVDKAWLQRKQQKGVLDSTKLHRMLFLILDFRHRAEARTVAAIRFLYDGKDVFLWLPMGFGNNFAMMFYRSSLTSLAVSLVALHS